MSRALEIRAVVEAAIHRVLSHSGRSRVALRDEQMLFADVGLDSLDLAQVIVTLEQELGVDPFRQRGAPIRTFGDLLGAYSAALEKRK